MKKTPNRKHLKEFSRTESYLTHDDKESLKILCKIDKISISEYLERKIREDMKNIMGGVI